MTVFGDADPEDGYDASDPIPTRLFVIGRIVEALAREPDPARRARRRENVLRLLRLIADQIDADG